MNPKLVSKVLQDLQAIRFTLTPAEQEVLVNLRFQGRPPTQRQLAVLSHIAERAFSPEIAAELRGQQRLFPETTTS